MAERGEYQCLPRFTRPRTPGEDGWSTYPVWVGHPYAEAKRLLKVKQASGEK
jgi:hypothetical protein